jgi:hypothetical protein
MFTQDDKDWYKAKLYQYGETPRQFYHFLMRHYSETGRGDDAVYLKEIINEYDKFVAKNGSI